jgi:hypothetical protein
MSDMRNIERERYHLLPAGDVTFDTVPVKERRGGGGELQSFFVPAPSHPVPSCFRPSQEKRVGGVD